MKNKTDFDWEEWGKHDPYFGVISSDQYRKNNLNEKVLNDFFNTGKLHVENLLDLISQNYNEKFIPNTVLDFGCGVGRLTIPFSEIANQVVGIDISSSMLALAKQNALERNSRNTEFLISDDELSLVTNKFSLVHSYIVLQHIPPVKGEKIVIKLANKVETNGFLALHIFTSTDAGYLVRQLVKLRYLFPPFQWIWNLTKGRRFFEPPMQLHVYDTQHLENGLKSLGFQKIKFIEVPGIKGFKGAFLIAKRDFE